MTDMTPAQNMAEAQDILRRLSQNAIGPGTPMYANLAQRAIGHGLLAATGVLTEILALMDAKQAPAVPGLPRGYDIATQQAPDGQRKWRYVVTGPQFSHASRHRYDTSEAALGAGITHAREQEQHRQGETWKPLEEAAREEMARIDPLLAAAREAQALNEPVHVTQNGGQA